jgi:hypothetical protein
MAHSLTYGVWPPAGVLRPGNLSDDPLGAARGIIFGVLLSLVGFWLPLSIALLY